jgi:hypothetical protein
MIFYDGLVLAIRQPPEIPHTPGPLVNIAYDKGLLIYKF